jgi:NRPS condensation-like uncharacterized protein
VHVRLLHHVLLRQRGVLEYILALSTLYTQSTLLARVLLLRRIRNVQETLRGAE